MFKIRPFLQSDIVSAHALSISLNWPHRLADWQMMVDLGRGYVACAGTDILGTSLWWPYGDDHGSIGMVIVSPAAQGRGIGRAIMDRLLADVQGRTIHLNSTEAGIKLYQRLGFEPVGTIRQFQGMAVSGNLNDHLQTVRSATVNDLAALNAAEKNATGLDRKQVLVRLLKDGNGVIAVDAASIVSYAFRRNFGRGELIGPVVASSEAMAKSLIGSLISTARGFVRIDCIEPQSSLASWLVARGLADCGPVTRMVRGALPTLDKGSRQFAVASQAFG